MLGTADDTENIEQPDTPAPVFAARALKHAIFGTPVGSKEIASKQETKPAAASIAMHQPANIDSNEFDSPSKPNGILLTPGTGTSRRKRVSFGRDVKHNAVLADLDATRARPRTRLQEILESSRRQNARLSDPDHMKTRTFTPDYDETDEWEEVDDLDGDPDITVDLNEPRSQSGLYWKTEFQKYHDEARAEMEKLVKYKQLAKSYAKAKDAEALDLNERLREEQDKVLQMEKKVADLAGRIGAEQGQGEGTRDDRKLLRDLRRETTLAMQYRNQVEELETLLKESGYSADGTRRRRAGASLPISQTLEDQRELRKARERLKELSDARQELQRVKSNLSAAEQRERKLELEKRKISADLIQSEFKIAELERKLSKAEHERQRKDSQYEKLKADYDALKERKRAHKEGITGYKGIQRASRVGDTQTLRDITGTLSAGHTTRDPWANELEDLQAKLKEEQEARRREMEDASLTINNLRQEFKRSSGFKSLDQRLLELRHKDEKAPTLTLDNITQDLLQRRPLREKRQTELPLRGSISRGSKRKASGPIATDRLLSLTQEIKLDPPDRRRSVMPYRGTRAPSSIRKRSSAVPEVQRILNNEPSSPAFGLARDRSRARKLEPVLDNGGVDTALSRSALSADRRAAAMARLEQKRAERKRGQDFNIFSGKENLRI
ncbi:hypothetical protein SLS53_000530 [Cytospora paraplurivora]|uniref:Spindle pole body-associated protein cut12 domain-containing protein n=1 Tax=Cytospora paraplurivora TaxID=2898453 RepID=A0AAN9UY54_9PEZI